ncbi:MAG: GNAT family N-acetyltransferase [Actinobacteria bacterium]|jgi:GNAT superfamily N-acetyltransferase|nr:MAG: GNAT family N-acetyltransferase [Actinomycetota bacterium]
MEIRTALPRDAADLVRLRAIMLEQVIGGPPSPQDMKIMEDYFRDWDYEDPVCLVAEEDGEVFGCISSSFNRLFPSPKNPSGMQAEIHNLAVYEEHRGKGIGRALLASILRECRERNVGRISLYATGMGRPLYESFGFSHEVIVCPEMRLYYRDLAGLDL